MDTAFTTETAALVPPSSGHSEVDLDDGWTGEASADEEAWLARNTDAVRALCDEAIARGGLRTDAQVGRSLRRTLRKWARNQA